MDDSDYSGASAPIYAAAATECVRLLKQSTQEADGLHDAIDVSALLWNVSQLLDDLPCALRQVSMWLDQEAVRERVQAVCGPYEHRPDEAVGVVSAYITAVQGVLEQG